MPRGRYGPSVASRRPAKPPFSACNFNERQRDRQCLPRLAVPPAGSPRCRPISNSANVIRVRVARLPLCRFREVLAQSALCTDSIRSNITAWGTIWCFVSRLSSWERYRLCWRLSCCSAPRSQTERSSPAPVQDRASRRETGSRTGFSRGFPARAIHEALDFRPARLVWPAILA